MKIRLMSLPLFAGLFALFGCSPSSSKYRSVGVEEFASIISDTSVVCVDVRTSQEYAEGHIADAMNIDVMGEEFEKKATALLPKDRTIAIYCRSGRRSKTAALILSDKGYDVVELNTGYTGWVTSQKP